MNDAHLHLIVNHVSLFALVIGFFVLAVSMKKNSRDLRILASVLFVIAGVFGFIAVDTGGDAVDIVKALGGNTQPFIEEHALAAVWAQRSGILVAILALAMEWAACKKPAFVRKLQWVLLIVSLHGVTVFARTAFLGGQIIHTEVR